MTRWGRRLKAVALAGLITLVFFFAPIVPYIQSASVPGAYEAGIDACLAGVSQDNLTLASQQTLGCEREFKSPPVAFYGAATPAFGLLGYGTPPYPSEKLVTQGNHTALVYFDRGRAVAVEDLGPANIEVQPRGVAEIMSAEVSSYDFGLLNISIKLRNVGISPIFSSAVLVSMYGYSANGSIGGLPLLVPKLTGTCGSVWNASSYCSVSRVVPDNLQANRSISFGVEVKGTVEGAPFVIKNVFGEAYPRGGIGPNWVSAFVDDVDRARQGSNLAENSTLDRFAELRFLTASAGYQVSDYGLSNDTSGFFGQSSSASQIEEVLLYPGLYTPASYADFLSGFAIGHWDALTNGAHRQFGYFVGHGLYYEVSIPCSVYEIPSAGLNISQYFHHAGCSTRVVSATWLVMILGP